MLLSRDAALSRAEILFTVSCRRFAPGDVFVAAPEDVTYLVNLVEPLTTEAMLALNQVPPSKG